MQYFNIDKASYFLNRSRGDASKTFHYKLEFCI